MPKITHATLKKTALSKPHVKAEYDALFEEFSLLEKLVKARTQAKKTQEDVAKLMKTTTSVVGRLETDGGKHHHSPTLAILNRYAKAVGCELEVQLVRRRRATGH